MTKFTWGFTGRETTKEDIADCAPPGWRPLVLETIDKLLALGWNGTVFQVKEKFGGLRLYIAAGTNEMHDLCNIACKESQSICEECGEPGKLYTQRWWRTLCDKHALERGYVTDDITD